MFYESEKLFSDLKDGNKEALEHIIANEKPMLFDFLVRLTGNYLRSGNAITQAQMELKKTPPYWNNWSDLRVSIYQSARTALSDIWGLENCFDYNSELKKLQSIDGAEDTETKASTTAVLQSLNSLSPDCLEVLLLHQRLLFSFSDIATIVNKDKMHAEEKFKKALGELNSSSAITGDRIAKELSQFEPIPLVNSQYITNLSDVMHDITDGRLSTSRSNRFFKITLLILVIVGIFFLLKHSDIKEVLDSMKEMGKGFPGK